MTAELWADWITAVFTAEGILFTAFLGGAVAFAVVAAAVRWLSWALGGRPPRA